MDFGLVTVARAAEIPAARAMIDSARRGGFNGPVHAVVLGLSVDPSALDDAAIDFAAVMPDPSTARTLAPLGFGVLSAAVIASAMLHALRTERAVVYLAPTIHVLGVLDDLAALADHRLALVERPRAGAPDDGMHPNEVDLVRGHRYSPSIVVATRDGRAALEWWHDTAAMAMLRGETCELSMLLDRLAHRFGVATPLQPSRFADWYSLGVDHPHDDGERVTVGEHAIVTVDAKLDDPRHPHRLDAHQLLPHRVTLADLPTLAAALDRRPSPPDVDDRPRLATDVPFDYIMRDAYRSHLREAIDAGTQAPPNPYDEATGFLEWLQASDFPGTSRPSRYLRQVYLSRPDLSRAFPEVPGRDTASFYAWAREHGRTEVPIPAVLLPPAGNEQFATAAFRPRTEGVNLAGFLDDALGIGEVARRIGASLAEAGIPHAAVAYARDRGRGGGTAKPEARYDVNLVCINPDSLASFANDASDDFFTGRYTIGVWFWETAVLPPSFGWAFEMVDEVWCASDFVVDAVAARAHERAPVWKFPLAIVAPTVDLALDRARLGLPTDRFVFVVSFDHLSVLERKNPIGAIEAFRRAFAVADGAALVVKSINGHLRPDDHARVRHAARGRDDIIVIDRHLAATANASLIATADCVVSLHRSEGFGFNLADAIALGRPVIATAYGGNLEFMADLDEWLVPYELVDVGEGQHPYPSDAQWADPDLDTAAALMRSVFDNPARARARAQLARLQLTERFSPASAGATIARRLGALAGVRPKHERRGLRHR